MIGSHWSPGPAVEWSHEYIRTAGASSKDDGPDPAKKPYKTAGLGDRPRRNSYDGRRFDAAGAGRMEMVS
ncbi:hypothetical protein GCM10027599_20260 [Yimella radicis]